MNNMENWNREEAKREFRQNEIRILKDQWFQQDLREAEMKERLECLPLLPNIRHRPLVKSDRTQQNRQKIQLNLHLKQMEAEKTATEFKRKMRHQQIENLQKIWLEQDMQEAQAKAEAKSFFCDLSVSEQSFQ